MEKNMKNWCELNENIVYVEFYTNYSNYYINFFKWHEKIYDTFDDIMLRVIYQAAISGPTLRENVIRFESSIFNNIMSFFKMN